MTTDSTQDDLAFLAAMLELIPKGHATASEYERLERLAETYLAARFSNGSSDVPDADRSTDRRVNMPKHVCRPEPTDERTVTCPVCLTVYVLDKDATTDEQSYAEHSRA